MIKKFIITMLLVGILFLSLALTGCTKNQSSDNQTNNEETKKQQAEMQQKKAVEEKQKEQDEKQKQLEDKYQEGYKAFYSKKYAEAIGLENQVLQEDNQFYKAYTVKGIALCYNHNFQEGMNNINQALAIKPDDGYSRFNKALANELYGHYDEALTWYDKALEVTNDEWKVWSYYGISSIYGRRGDVPNTVRYLQKAIEIDPGVKGVAKDEADFNPVKNSKEFKDLIK